MNELERLAVVLEDVSEGRYRFTKDDLEKVAAILLAASKVDVAGLMELVAKVSNAAYVAGLQDANGEGCDATAQTLFEDELETALRMALANPPTGLDPEMGWLFDGATRGELAAYDFAVATHCQAVLKILDGKDGGTGTNNEPWATVRKRLLSLAQREWVGLTDAEIHNLDLLPHQMHDQERIDYAKSIEAKLKEKNHG